jgi:hypothetical protein
VAVDTKDGKGLARNVNFVAVSKSKGSGTAHTARSTARHRSRASPSRQMTY